ncbi:MAG: rod shape-determining protein MreC [Oscillospiraceae bacterium]|nr:rod shape-determining protein MreC [Oscillospiraceae bacterium]
MKNLLTGRVRLILAIAMVLAILLAVVGVVTQGATPGEKVVGALLSPFRSLAAGAVRGVERAYDYMFRYEMLEEENKALKEKLALMEEDIRSAQAFRRENERLTELLGLKEAHDDYDFLSAYVASWDASNWKSACTISKGTSSGVEEGMCAVTEHGQVIGLVTATGPGWATITTILDPSMEISASITATGYNGVVQGFYEKNGALRLNYLPTDAVIKNNDQVVTTGSTLYPKNLILGYVSDAKLDETGVGKYALLRPAADFDNLEQIFLITNYVT